MIKLERKEFNKKIYKLKKLASYEFEVGLFEAEEARKGRLLDEGDGPEQVARPWFSQNMKPNNKDLQYFVRHGLIAIYKGKMTPKQFSQILTEYCKDGLDDSDLKPGGALKEITLLYKAGLLKRPDTGRKRQSKGAAEDIGRDSGKMYKAITTKVTKVTKKGGKNGS